MHGQLGGLGNYATVLDLVTKMTVTKQQIYIVNYNRETKAVYSMQLLL